MSLTKVLLPTLGIAALGIAYYFYSQLRKQQQAPPQGGGQGSTRDVRVKQIFVYPIKGCKGISVLKAKITRFGFLNDRRWLVIDPTTKRFLTQRQLSRMSLISPSLENDYLVVEAPEMDPIKIPLQDNLAAPRFNVSVWGDSALEASLESESVCRWFSDFLQRPVEVVRMSPDYQRMVDPKYWTDEFPGSKQTSFSDGFPFLLISQESLDSLNEKLDHPLTINRFRPNIFVEGASAPFNEDTWRTIKIGADNTIFHGVKKCSRCKVTTIDQERGIPTPDIEYQDDEGVVKKEAEPLRTLRTFRTEAGEKKGAVYFGQNLIHEKVGGFVSVGDIVEILS
eukprot:TRINITY_DN2810_c0_g3_i6.p1 TRINITY_DN2810_c0_g3~~TRINITY_DN2810_c0_g3_i6.p1  ORF type:complete len:338 (-),score=62.44 TRINITY_DN2810_c0_g3_i6:88-1101(-)